MVMVTMVMMSLSLRRWSNRSERQNQSEHCEYCALHFHISPLYIVTAQVRQGIFRKMH
jgi:hypothetical protein